MSERRKQAIKKIIREEIASYYEKILVEKGTGMHRNGNEPGFTQGMGLRGGAATLPEPAAGREQECIESDMGGCIDPPGLKHHFVESTDMSHEEEGLDDLGEPIQRFRGQRRPGSVVEPLKTEERKISRRLSEAPSEQDEQFFGVNTTNTEPPEVQAADLNYNLEDPPRDLPPEPPGAPVPGDDESNIKFESKLELTENEIRYLKKLANL